MANVRDHVLTVPVGAVRDIKHNVSTFLFIKETNAPIPVVRIDQGQRFVNVKQGHSIRTVESFTSTQFDNTTGAVELQIVATTGVGGYSTNEVAGSVLIEGGALDSIVNPVQVINVPPAVVGDPSPNPIQVVNPDGSPVGGGLGETVFQDVANTTFTSLLPIAANTQRVRLFVTVLPTSSGSLYVTQAGAGGGATGVYVQPGETFEMESTSAVDLRTANTASLNIQVRVTEIARV